MVGMVGAQDMETSKGLSIVGGWLVLEWLVPKTWKRPKDFPSSWNCWLEWLDFNHFQTLIRLFIFFFIIFTENFLINTINYIPF
jgi:hypothetical protein